MKESKTRDFQSILEKQRLDASIFLCSEPIHDSNIQYFTGFQQTRFHAFSCLIITQSESILVSSRLEYDRAVKEAKAGEIVNLKEYDNSLTRVLKEKLKYEKSIGIMDRIFPYKLAKNLKGKKFQDISSLTDDIRSIKTREEMGLIKKSCQIADHGIKLIEQELSTRITEKELVLILEQELIRRGAYEIAFPTILTSGERSAYIHPEPAFSDKNVQKGLGLIDFGARYKGYCSDITVPFSIGKLNENQKKIIKTTQEAYQCSIDTLEEGMPAWKVFDLANKVLEKHSFEFKHSLGHGLGLDVHESPSLSPKPQTKRELKEWEEAKLKEGMIFTIEPGVYVPDVGGCRLENDVLMTKRGAEILTRSKLIEL
ncbi:MAG: hypothetical protein COY38_04100 [Candidatus Aenigmarchaeota archaeon CG_4_10_14_0_8_um_filter_37_24]|nr:aminopeptidase P family protein [Candidatus Aenigmarchaeota archaeon]OIN85359.1 MAG: hypothetical protein AUJ50_05300 [Candidatus Aenigmarchaeota archaeon CG1_02_38_14]PIW41261.1 MAG: hypothetical protein COW21_02855 [Candidatus Aenigmarchaeota archaeon CG15_BIG_FIL_POST_REV_8_21_14_020_37_27]PIX51178.1 MAG: hypothetical protein COZ52_00370 [Candidatus Aenigmarchaeota archaeon CG_4_8_14_3_um_filter_37_24]PIY36501.1 MAG: hypothetical protein COZ04_00195 [Candidatus Aenigmarchaeota archaeon CG